MRSEGFDPTGSINIRHHSVGDRELTLAIGARKPPTAFAARLRVIDMPRAIPLGDLIRCGAKVAAVQPEKVLTHTQYSYAILSPNVPARLNIERNIHATVT